MTTVINVENVVDSGTEEQARTTSLQYIREWNDTTNAYSLKLSADNTDLYNYNW